MPRTTVRVYRILCGIAIKALRCPQAVAAFAGILLFFATSPARATEQTIHETDLSVGPCAAQAGVCLRVAVSAAGAPREFLLSPNPAATAIHIGLMGRQFGGNLPAAFVYWLTGENSNGSSGKVVALSVFDLNGAGAVARVEPPHPDSAQGFEGYSIEDTYFAVVQGPDGKRYPFLAPGRRYLNKPHWDYLCLFDPAKIAQPDPGCGTGFRKATIRFPGDERLSGFRHNGGWLEDVDGDGWQDINLPFLRYILVVSGRTGAELALLHPQIAEHGDPDDPADFEAGRLYGSFAPFIGEHGAHDVLIVSGAPVGGFDDINCNVSRYVAVLRSGKANDPASRQVEWADYISFDKNYFGTGPAAPETIIRHGDNIDKCVHRVSNGLFSAEGRPFTLYNLFRTNPPLAPDICLGEQIAEWNAHFPVDKMHAWTECARAAFGAARGNWQVDALDLRNGRQIATLPNSYIWGRVRNFAPGITDAFIVEATPEGLRFDQTGYRPTKFLVVALKRNFTWQTLGTLPSAQRPRMLVPGPDPYPYQDSDGSTSGPLTEIATRPGADGLTEIQLQDGNWVGYSTAAKGFVVRDTTRTP